MTIDFKAIDFKAITHVFAGIVVAGAAFATTPAGQALVAQYPKLSIAFAALGTLAALYHDPKPVDSKPPVT